MIAAMSNPAGTAGYAEDAARLAVQYESVTLAEVHGAVLHLFPPPPARVLDIGAGTGRDAAALAALGHRVLAVEPTAELRAQGARLHPAGFDWLDDGLPDLGRVRAIGETFDLLLLSAVWMHLDEEERERAMPAVAGLLAPGGIAVLTLRHGPVPAGRRMFDVSAGETISLGARSGLVALHLSERPALLGRKDMLGRSDVTWSTVALKKPTA